MTKHSEGETPAALAASETPEASSCAGPVGEYVAAAALPPAVSDVTLAA